MIVQLQGDAEKVKMKLRWLLNVQNTTVSSVLLKLHSEYLQSGVAKDFCISTFKGEEWSVPRVVRQPFYVKLLVFPDALFCRHYV